MSKIVDEYVKRIREILDEAAEDRDNVSGQDYADICNEVGDEASGRGQAALNDLDSENEED